MDTRDGTRLSAPAARTGASGSRRRALVAVLVVLVALGNLVVGLPTAAAVADPAPQPAIAGDQFQTGPTANLTVAPNPAHPGQDVVLDATASNASGADEVARCQFDVDGDGTYEEATTDCRLQTTYDAVGEYLVAVRVTTAENRTATDEATLVVRENRPPRAGVSVDPVRPATGQTVTLSGNSSVDEDGEITEYIWQIAGEGATGEVVETRFETAGTYEVRLLVRDDDGAENRTETTVAVGENRAPSAALDVSPAAPTVGERVTLDASGSSDPDGDLVAYRWDLDGDGTVDRETEPPTTELTVETTGELSVGVTVVDDGGAEARTTAQFAVAPASTETPATTPSTDDGGGPERPASADWFGALDPGIVPGVPDWLVAVLLVVLAGATGLVVRRREAVRDRASRAREALGRGDTRRQLARKASAFVSKTIVKRTLRRLADAIELSGRTVGDGFERIGGWIRGASQRVADALRRLGG